MSKKEVTQAKINEWKKKYGDIFHYKVDGKECYLRNPDRKTLSAAATVGRNDPLRYNEILLQNCWIEGDEEIKTDDQYFLGISSKLAEIVEVKEGTLKKL
jgi:hypothetical protein